MVERVRAAAPRGRVRQLLASTRGGCTLFVFADRVLSTTCSNIKIRLKTFLFCAWRAPLEIHGGGGVPGGRAADPPPAGGSQRPRAVQPLHHARDQAHVPRVQTGVSVGGSGRGSLQEHILSVLPARRRHAVRALRLQHDQAQAEREGQLRGVPGHPVPSGTRLRAREAVLGVRALRRRR
uniref:Uncharacterized protein n=1 Tax=Bombyx mori TaxID=7091 RepID=A0A8R2R0Y1_BOMMO|nr:uncharacterized protein LOC101739911 isoform X4 [Bombyx mori]